MIINFKSLAIILFIGSLLTNCTSSHDTVVASYKDEKLTLSELREHIPRGCGEVDSTRYANLYIEEWKMEQCLVDAAFERDGDVESKIENKLKDYRRKMIISELHKYLINNNPLPTITDDEAEKYYKDNIQQFISQGNLYWYGYIRSKDPSVQNFSQKLMSPNEIEKKELLDWCKKNAIEYKLDEVYEAPHIINHLSDLVQTDLTNIAPNSPTVVLISNPNPDGNNPANKIIYHLFYMRDIVKPGKNIPFASLKNDIKRILLQKKQKDAIEQFEAGMYERAKSTGEFDK